MKEHIITDEEVERFGEIYDAAKGLFDEAVKAALLDFLANRPESTLGKLRPIAEMPETVPDGCKRMYWGKDGRWWLEANKFVTHAIDIQLPTPDPEAEERQRFEEAMKKARGWPHDKFLKNEDGSYFDDQANPAWTAWKLSKAK